MYAFLASWCFTNGGGAGVKTMPYKTEAMHFEIKNRPGIVC